METFNKFINAPTFKVKNFNQAISLAKKIRQNDSSPVKIILEEDSFGVFSFPYSNFYITSKNKVKIYGERSAKDRNSDMKGNTTWRTAILTVTGSGNIFENLIIANQGLRPQKHGQQVALSDFGDENIFVFCNISSSQDTLFLGPLPDDLMFRYIGFIPEEERFIEGNRRHYFYSCHISGGIDFIFGAGQGVFLNCQIESKEDSRFNITYITAPAHSAKDNFGFCFEKCQFISNTILQQRVYLARPWRDFGKSVFHNCTYSKHICTSGVTNWDLTQRQLTARFREYPLRPNRIDFFKELTPEEWLKVYEPIIKEFEKSLDK